MLNQLLQLAYPHLSENPSDLDNYYLVRLGELWGEDLIEEYISALQSSRQANSAHSKQYINCQPDPIPSLV